MKRKLKLNTLTARAQSKLHICNTKKSKNTVKSVENLYKVFTDGGVRSGNPGIGASSYIIKFPDGKRLEGVTEHSTKVTNNEMEYDGVITALEKLLELRVEKCTIDMCCDSLLVVQQVNCLCAVNQPHLMKLVNKIWGLIGELESNRTCVKLRHIRRELNTEADAICTKYLDDITKHKRGY